MSDAPSFPAPGNYGSLVSAIDDLLTFAAKHDGERLTAGHMEKCDQLDARIETLWGELKIPPPSHPNRQSRTGFSYLPFTQLPFQRESNLSTVDLWAPDLAAGDDRPPDTMLAPDDDWRASMRRLKMLAVATSKIPHEGEQQGTTKPKRKRGRPTVANRKNDKHIFDAWCNGDYKTYDDLGAELHMPGHKVQLAIDRHRKRMKRAGQ
jgi:hypothetical protein